MNWTYGGVRVFTTELDAEVEQILAKLNPLGGGTIVQVFGNKERSYRATGYVVGSGDMSHLESLTTSGVSFPYLSPYGNLGDYYLESLKYKISKGISQTLRSDLACNAPVYIVEMELALDND